MNKILLITSLFLMVFVIGCSCLKNGRGLTEEEKLMLQVNPHVPLKLNN